MQIKNIELTSFGKFNNDTYEFKDGINIMFGKNEAGKTTIYNFISSFFYFLSSSYVDTKLIDESFDDYRPWYNDVKFEGNMVISRGDSEFSISKNFAENDGNLIVQKDYFKVLDNTDEEYSRLSKEAFVSLIGVADLSGDNGRKVIKGTKDNIVDILSLSNPTLNYQNAITELESKINSLNNDKNISELKEEMENCKVKKAKFDLIRDDMKGLALKSYDLNEQKRLVEKKLADIEDSIKYLKYGEVKSNLNKVIELKETVESIETDIDELVIFNDCNLNVIEQYIEANSEIIDLENRIKERLHSVKVLETEISDLDINADEKAIKLMAEDMYASDFIADFENYIEAKRSIEEYTNKIQQYRHEIEESDEIQDREREKQELERDYFEASNNVKFLEKTGESTNLKIELNRNENTLKDLKSKEKGLFTYLLAAILSFFVFTVITVLEEPTEYFMIVAAIVIGICIGAIVVTASMLVKNKQDASQLEYMIEHLRLEEKQNSLLYDKTNNKIKSVLERYDFVSFKQLEHHYYELKNSVGDEHNAVIQLNEAIDNKEKAKSNEGMLYRRLVKWIDDTGLNGLISIDDDERAIRYIEDYSKRCVKYINYNNSVFRAKFDIEKDEEAIERLADRIKLNDDFSSLLDYSIEDIVDRKEKYLALNLKKKEVEDEQKGYLQGHTMLELEEKLIYEERNIEDINLTKVLDDDVDFLNDLLKRTNIEAGQLNAEIESVNANIVDNDRKLVGVKDINLKLEELDNELNRHNEKIQLLTNTLASIQSVVKKIYGSFEVNLQNNMNYFLMKLTDTYEEVKVDENQNVTVREAGRNLFIPVNKMSLGTRDLMAFILKLGLIKTVNDKNNDIPLVIDDAFIQFDDDRVGTVIREISKFKRQIIIITGQGREKRVCNRYGLEISYLQL